VTKTNPHKPNKPKTNKETHPKPRGVPDINPQKTPKQQTGTENNPVHKTILPKKASILPKKGAYSNQKHTPQKPRGVPHGNPQNTPI